MSVEETLEKYGFRISASCAGTATYTKWTKHNGKRAYITITDTSGEGLPTTLDEGVQVTTFDLRSGEELEPSQNVNSLNTYLESLEG